MSEIVCSQSVTDRLFFQRRGKREALTLRAGYLGGEFRVGAHQELEGPEMRNSRVGGPEAGQTRRQGGRIPRGAGVRGGQSLLDDQCAHNRRSVAFTMHSARCQLVTLVPIRHHRAGPSAVYQGPGRRELATRARNTWRNC